MLCRSVVPGLHDLLGNRNNCSCWKKKKEIWTWIFFSSSFYFLFFLLEFLMN